MSESLCKFQHLPSNFLIAIVVPRDRDLLFEDTYLNLLYHLIGKSKRKKCVEVFCNFDIFHRMVSMQNLYFVTLTYFFNVNFKKNS